MSVSLRAEQNRSPVIADHYLHMDNTVRANALHHGFLTRCGCEGLHMDGALADDARGFYQRCN